MSFRLEAERSRSRNGGISSLLEELRFLDYARNDN
jgi:hypothetical protein